MTSPAGGAFGAGQIVSFDSATGVGTTIYSFTGNEDGGTPTGAAVKLHGKLYGVTASGGAYGLGTVYMVNPADGRQMTLHGFAGGTDGASPAGPLVFFNGLLYGTTLAGGDTTCSIGYNGCGIIFSIDPVSGSETVLHAFQGTPADGAGPRAALIALNGELYGTASGGGTDSSGVIFKFDPASNVENVVFDFTGNNGAGPGGPLLEAEGLLYGTTVFGGTHCCGTLFSFDPATAAETVLHTFGRAKGDEPTAGLTRIGKRLYGATDDGGTADYGSLFGFDTATNTIKFLHQFSGADGGFAFGTPVNFQGTIYGTTSSGGTQSIGTIFAIQP